MKKKHILMAVVTACSAGIHAQDIYGGLGAPGLYTLAYAQPLSSSVGLHAEYGSGLSVNKDGTADSINVTGSFKAGRLGAFADWYPFSSGFRLVGGLTLNDIKSAFSGTGGISTAINSFPVNLASEIYKINAKYPDTTAYLGVGYGHQLRDIKGLGFYADLGVTIGSFGADTTASQLNLGKVSQVDLDTQTQRIRDALGSLSVLPSASLGLLYRY